MKHLPRPVADLIRLWHDLALQPREVLLNRCHHQWRGAGFIAVVAVLVVTGTPGFPAGALLPTLLFAGPSWFLDLAGTLAHGLWQSGRIWQGVECDCCGGDPDDGDDEAEPDDPADGGGLARDIENWLKGQPAPHPLTRKDTGMDLANVMARHRQIAIDALTRTITTTPETHPELLQYLNQMWWKEAADRTSEDRVWIEAVANLAPELRTSLRVRAYNAAQYAAARCLTYVSATTPA